MKFPFVKKGSFLNLLNLFIVSILCINFASAQCSDSDELENQATGNGAIKFTSHSKVMGMDCVSFVGSDSSQVTVSNDHSGQPWARYRIEINLADNGLVAGDELEVSIEAIVGSGQQGRVEFIVNNAANNHPSFKTFNSSGNHQDTFTIPAGATTIDIWMFSNYNSSNTGGSVIYKNLSVSKVGATDTQNPSTPENLTPSNVTSNSVNLSWSASSDNVGVTSYTLFTNNTNGINVGNGTSYQVNGLSPSTSYSFLIQALDGAGNVSGNSNLISITTASSGSGGSLNSDSLLKTDSWVIGNGSVAGYSNNGTNNENERVTGTDPFGNNNSIIWKAIDQGNDDIGGGWNSSYLDNINPNKTYRFTVWMKKEGPGAGFSLFGAYAQNDSNQYTALTFDDTVTFTPYFSGWSNPPSSGEWFLYVGYFHPSTYGGASIGGIYDTGGALRGSLTDFKMASSTTKIAHRAFLYGDTTSEAELYFFSPTIYEVELNNEQPSIQNLIDGSNSDTSGGGDTGTTAGLWSKTSNTDNIYFTSGSVGIGTTNLDSEWQLAVNGNIRAKKIKVETNWADYVFYNDYNLPTLGEVEKHIQEKGHLINIPSAAEVEANGVELGEMNKLLLEKIEELTLYILEQEDRIKKLEETVSKK